ncbi:3-deoxy-D-manno-octulosonic acid kinase [Vibrio sp. ABG19]|uniref:3-deoxy-D-manno-octulosonic acid kinase n=1 Tax=Vibrio sp. ABG19 TaxID=2817385 RepID=UPI00249E9959|nr:3-deoxy-D-manno-octulosonic acid kinase [Vibrio sp. ABG19]WGY48676.1 3-deoxy-D-manno-octulosonic acid kinase [Vibrio sp. ABG19]
MSDIRNIPLPGQQIWYDAELLSTAPEHSFDPDFWQRSGKVTGSAQGRGTTWFVQLEACQGALRHYRRGGLFGKLVSDHYLFTGWENTRSAQEFELLRHLAEAGVNVPRPIAARARRSGFSYQADILVEKVPNASDLVDVLQKQALSDEVYQAIGRMIRTMHEAGVNHTDLNIHNILLDKAGKVWLIDFDKCARQAGDGWKEANLARLLRSFRKEVDKRQIHWSLSDFKVLKDGYHANL